WHCSTPRTSGCGRPGPVSTLGGRLLTAARRVYIGTRTGRVLTARIPADPTVTRQRRHAPMNLKPLDDRIVVKPNEAETQTASGLVIPDTAKEKPQQGSVLAVGPGKRSDTTGELIPVDI